MNVEGSPLAKEFIRYLKSSMFILVSLGYKRELGGGERPIFCLSYGQVVQAHSNHNIVIKL